MPNFFKEKKEILLILLIQVIFTYVIVMSIHRTDIFLIFFIYELMSIMFSVSIFKIGRKKHKGETWWKVIFGFDLLLFVFGLPIFLIGIIALLLNYG